MNINKTLAFILFCSISLATPFSVTFTTQSDFSSGEAHNILIVPDPVFPSAALTLAEFDTIRVLQIIPPGHCANCLARTVDSLAPYGDPPLVFGIEIIDLEAWNSIDSLRFSFRAQNPSTMAYSNRNLLDFDVILFGIANGYGGDENDLDDSGKRMVREFAGLGRGIVLTHDTIAKRRGPGGTTMFGTFIHENFNDIADVTGLTAEWVANNAATRLYYEVERYPSAPAGATILHAPFELPAEFDITACHEFGEHYSAGQVWFVGPDDEIYMHSYFSPDYGSFASYFSTGHAEEWEGTSFRPAPWEGKAMINAMYYSYFGGLGSGVFTSAIFTAPCPGGLIEMTTAMETPDSSSIVIELSSSADAISWSPWEIVVSGGAIPPSAAEGPFYKYRVSMSRSAISTPILHSISFRFELPSPRLDLLNPPISSFYSCSCGSVTWKVVEDAPIEPASANIVVNSVSYGPSRSLFSAEDSVYTFLGPEPCWMHGVTYYGLVERLSGESGCPRTGDTTFVFTADFRPPVFSALSPIPGSVISDETPIIVAYVSDSTSGIETSHFRWVVEADTFAWGATGLSWNGTTGRLSLTASAAGLSLSGDIRVCATGGDRAIGCGANIADTCWSFYIDNIGPTAEMISPPGGFLSCDSLRAAFLLQDTSNIDPTEIIISIGADTLFFPEGMSFSAGTLLVQPDIPVENGDTIVVRFERLRDMLGNDGAPLDFTIIVDQNPPFVWERVPAEGGYVGLPAPTVSFRIADSLSGLAEESISVTVDGATYSTSEGLWDGELLRLDGAVLGWDFAHDDSIVICVRAEDRAGGCGPNILEECWFFFVNLLGPQCSPIGPADGSVVGCDSFDIVFSLEDPNGIDPNTVSFSVNGAIYTTGSPEVSAHGDTFAFSPAVPFAHNDEVEVRIITAEDSLGNPLEVPCEWAFTVDIEPPRFSDLAPPNAGVVDTAQPVISVVITDESGLGLSTIELCTAGDCWTLGGPALSMAGDTLIFKPEYISYFFDEESVFVTVHACDSTQWCGPNCSDTSWFFWIDKLGPRAVLVNPISGTYSSCEGQGFVARLIDPSGIVLDSVEMTVNGAVLRWPSSALDFRGDSLIFTPTAPWSHLDTVEFVLYSAYDSLGNPLQDTILTQVIIDLFAPVIEIVSPLPGATDALPSSPVVAVLTDDACGVDIHSIDFLANGTHHPLGGQLALNGDSLIFTPTSTHFPERETSYIALSVADCAEYCGANSAETLWSFFVPDDDTLGPVWLDFAPTVWLEDSAFFLTCRAVDPSGVYSPAGPNPLAPFFVWDTDSEIAIDADTVYLSLVSTSADTHIFESIGTLVSGRGIITLRATCWDNDFDFAVPEDRTRNDSPLWEIPILEPAKIALTLPIPGTITSCRDQVLRFSISGEANIDASTCVFSIFGENYTLASPELGLEGDSVFVFTPFGEIFSEGQISVALIEAFDEFGNRLHTPIEWIFSVDISTPIISLIRPNDGEMVDSAEADCEFNLYDLISPLDTSSIELLVWLDGDSTRLVLGEPGLEWDSHLGTLAFRPHSASLFFKSADSLNLRLCASDSPDLCEANRGCLFFSYWIEPEVQCSTSTDPFTPNQDGYNDEVAILWPGFYRYAAVLEIFDMRGASIVKISAPAGKMESASWNGLDKNGRKCPSGVYIYEVTVEGKRVCRGTVTLAR